MLSSEAAAIVAKQAHLVTSEQGAILNPWFTGTRSHRSRPPWQRAREVHLMVEILGVAYRDEESKAPATEWCQNTHNALVVLDSAMD